MLEVVQAEYVEGYKLKVSFSSGERGVVDLADALWGPIFAPLRNETQFQRFYLSPVLHTIAWENEADFAPEYRRVPRCSNRRRRAPLCAVSELTTARRSGAHRLVWGHGAETA